MNDERLGQAAGKWLRDIESPPTDPDAGVQRAMAQITETRQTRSRWRFPPRRGRGHTTTASPTVTGRTRPMLSPVTAIAAVIFAAGGVFLVAQSDQSGTTAPGADAAPLQEPSAFDGRIQYTRTIRDTRNTTFRDGVTEGLDGAWFYRIVEMSDPRFTGDVTVTGNVHTFEHLDAAVWNSDLRIENEEGAWQKEPSTVVRFGPEAGSTSTVLLEGEGDYEGLVAVIEMVYDLSELNTAFDLRGFVMDADDLPPALSPQGAAE